jgi:flagellar basal-body rod protein FlgB
MGPIHLFDITSQKNQWLSARQAVIAGNIANANTPGYQTLDLQPFEEVLRATSLQMAATRPGHMAPETGAAAAGADTRPGSTWDIVHSGNSVSMEKELMKSGEVSSTYSLNTSVMKAFQRMLLTSARTG